MVDLLSTIMIDRPREEVASFSADPSNAPAWYANIKTVAWHGDPDVAEGAQIDFIARFLGRTLQYTYEIVEYTPGARLVMRTAQGPFPMQTTYEWSDNGNGTTMTCETAANRAAFRS